MPLNKRILNWKGQRVWIIGASTGIGAALAEALVARGANVAVSARRAEPLALMAERLGSAQCLALPLDLTQLESVSAAHAKLVTTWQGFDLVVFMAGDYKAMRAWDIDLAVARQMIDVNLTGCYNGLSLVVPQLLKQGSGGIALVSSVAGYRGLPKSLVYGPTKAALINLAETLYLDLEPKGLGVYVINPGFVKTPLTDQNEFKMPHLITAEAAAQHIIDGFEDGDFEIHFPRAFTRQLKFLRHLPYRYYFSAVRRAARP
jgi:short-subunit dehydrogenase